MLEHSPSPRRPLSPTQPVNLFFALLPEPEAAIQAHKIACHHSVDRRMTGKPMARSRLHITLFSVGGFFGEIPDGLMRRTLVAGDAISIAPFRVALDRAVSFARSTGKRPYVLLGGDGVVNIVPLYRAVAGSLLKSGLDFQAGSAFNPHMTLLYDSKHHMELPVEPVSWVAREFVLIESWVGLTQHHVRGRWTLQG